MDRSLLLLSSCQPSKQKTSRWREGLRLAPERPLGGRDFPRGARVDCERCAQRARKALEAGLRDVVVVGAVECFDVQRDAGIHRKGLEPLLHQFGIERADLVTAE